MKDFQGYFSILGSLFIVSGTGAEENGWPEALEVKCAEVEVRVIGKARWTLNRIAFRGKELTTERSAYGTVFSFPDIGFIGTGHLENEAEDVRALQFFLDGERVDGRGGALEGEVFRMERRSRIKGLDLHGTVDVRGGRLLETARVSCREATPLKLVYHFMHAWRPEATEFLAGADGGDAVAGVFEEGEEAKGFFVNDEMDWVAVYDGPNGVFAVSRLLEKPVEGGAMSKLWNVPGTYRKYYLQCFSNATVPAGFSGTWRMVTGFGEAAAGDWKARARELAEQLAERPLDLPISLDGGKRWRTDAHTRESLRRITEAVGSTPSRALGQKLAGEIKRLFEGCTLEGEAHNQLHVFLGELLAHVNGLYSAEVPEDREKEVAAIRRLLGAYGNYFE